MKIFFMVLIQLALTMVFLNAEGISSSTIDSQVIVVNSKKNKVDLIKKEWRRGYEKGFADVQDGKANDDRDLEALAKQIPTSEAFQSGYREGYQQGHR